MNDLEADALDLVIDYCDNEPLRETARKGLKELRARAYGNRCCNCGILATEAKSMIDVQEGEWACSDQCYSQHEELGCPHETFDGYRHPVETEKFRARDTLFPELVRALGDAIAWIDAVEPDWSELRSCQQTLTRARELTDSKEASSE